MITRSPVSFAAVRLAAEDPGIDWDRLIGEGLRRLGNPPVYTVWVDLPETRVQAPDYVSHRMPWWPYHRLMVIDANREPESRE